MIKHIKSFHFIFFFLGLRLRFSQNDVNLCLFWYVNPLLGCSNKAKSMLQVHLLSFSRRLMLLSMKKEILYRAALLVATTVITVTLHEIIHLIVGRALNIPAQFLNFTSVGVPSSDVALYSPISLAIMNGVAPVFSILFFGLLPLSILAKKNMKVREPWLSLLGWSAIYNVPYLGLQLMLAVNVSSANGSGSDMAAVMGTLAIPFSLRFLLGAAGYIVFVICLFILGRVLSSKHNAWPTPINKRRKCMGYLCILLGFVSNCFGGWITLSGNQNLGMTLVALVGFSLLGIGSSLLISFKDKSYLNFKLQWLFPVIVGTLSMVPIGILFQNDYAILWLILIPSVLGIGAVATSEPVEA